MRMEKGKLEVERKSNLGRNEETARPGASLWSSLVREEKGKDREQPQTVSTWRGEYSGHWDALLWEAGEGSIHGPRVGSLVEMLPIRS